jgi:hypothetical protein
MLGVFALGLGFSAPAFAGPDQFYANSATWSVNSAGVGNVTNAFVVGGNGSTTLNTDVHGGNAISVSAGLNRPRFRGHRVDRNLTPPPAGAPIALGRPPASDARAAHTATRGCTAP